jgi:hypothetical protein
MAMDSSCGLYAAASLESVLHVLRDCLCCGSLESVLHVLRDCLCCGSRVLLPRRTRQFFLFQFARGIQEWLLRVFCNKTRGRERIHNWFWLSEISFIVLVQNHHVFHDQANNRVADWLGAFANSFEAGIICQWDV